MSQLGDSAKNEIKYHRDHTPNVPPEYRNVRKSYQLDDQNDESTEIVPLSLSRPADDNPPVYYGPGPTNGETGPPDHGNREIFPPSYMTESEQTNAEPRAIGSLSDAVPAVLRPEGALPIVDQAGGWDTSLKAKKIINTASEGDENTTKNATGTTAPYGLPVLIVSARNARSHEYLHFTPGGILTVDHSKGSRSTKLFDVTSTGWIDTVRVASLDSLIRIARDEYLAYVAAINMSEAGKDTTGFGPALFMLDGVPVLCYMSYEKGGVFHPGAANDKHKVANDINPIHIDVNANFFMDYEKDGPLCFRDEELPAITEISNPEFYVEARIAYNNDSGKWHAYVPAASAETSIYARIRWHWQSPENEDRSEGEIVFFNQSSGQWEPLEEPVSVWIDTQLSTGVSFWTAGDDTIFRIKLIQSGVTRGNSDTRDLYRASHCVRDKGQPITHLETTSVDAENNLACGNCLTDEVLETPWSNTNSSAIKTTILGNALGNTMCCNVPREWEMSAEFFQFMEFSDFSRGLEFWVRPIEPALDDIDNRLWVSCELDSQDNPIATYLRRNV